MAATRFVEVAVDAVGAAGGRLYTYAVPEALAGLTPGDAVIVGYGRRHALGVVMAEAPAAPASIEVRPVLERVRSDGPLLPALQLRLASLISERYVAPPALVVRAMLPPGALERLELLAWPAPELAAARLPEAVARALASAGTRGVAVRRLPAGGAGRAGLLRKLRSEHAAGRLTLAWALMPAATRPRLARLARLMPAGRAALDGSTGPRLGPRQRALLTELRSLDEAEALPAAGLARRHGGSAVASTARRGFIALEVALVERRPLAGRLAPVARSARPSASELTDAQERAGRAIAAAVEARRAERFLLEGATAAGKTEVYLAGVIAALAIGRGALLLVPEIALAAPLLDRLRAALPGEPIGYLHSALAPGERADEWRRIRAGEVRVVIGTRLAILAPLGDPGVVIVDEEHDAAYKSDRTPRIQARDLALELGRLAGAPVVLGSATPDVVSEGMARAGQLVRLHLPARVAGSAARVEVVDLRQELRAGNRSLLSRALAEALGALERREGDRAILVLNRRGSATVVLCRDCGYVQICPDCHRPLVFHALGLTLRCHHCGAAAPLARRCPACGSARIRYLGGGTERLESEVRDAFPGLRVARLDRDVVERRGAAEQVIDAFTDGSVDVLVGTSLVTKGLDVPQVTLVGVVSADVALNLPDERAAERTYQLLRQAIGRAGRGDRAGHAILQTYQPDHRVIRAVAGGEVEAFYSAELETRRAFGSPPYGRLVKLTVADEDRGRAEAQARRLAARLRDRVAAGAGPDTVVLGPAPAYVARRAGRWRFHLVLRGHEPLATLGDDPGPPWSVDVDPESLL